MTIALEQLDALRDALQLTACFCGNDKRINQPFCHSCYSRLPQGTHTFLYSKDETRLAANYAAAVSWLQFHAIATELANIHPKESH